MNTSIIDKYVVERWFGIGYSFFVLKKMKILNYLSFDNLLSREVVQGYLDTFCLRRNRKEYIWFGAQALLSRKSGFCSCLSQINLLTDVTILQRASELWIIYLWLHASQLSECLADVEDEEPRLQMPVNPAS